MIKKKREERKERERLLRIESEKRREEILRKKRFRLPKIIVTYYEVQTRPQSQCSDVERRLPHLVNIPSGSQRGKEKEESDSDSQGSRGDRLEIPERLSPQELSLKEMMLLEGGEECETLFLKNETETQAVNGYISKEYDVVGADINVTLQDNEGNDSEGKVLEGSNQNGSLEEEQLELDKNETVAEEDLVHVSPTEPSKSLDNKLTQKSQIVNNTMDEPSTLASEQRETPEEHLDEQSNAVIKKDSENFEGKGLEEKVDGKENKESLRKKENEGNVEDKENEGKVEEKESKLKADQEKERTNDEKEKQMNYLVPPVAREYGSDNTSIGDADDTGMISKLKTLGFCGSVRIIVIIIHSTHYLSSDWPKAYSEFSKSAPGTSSSCRSYNNDVKVTGNHVMYDRGA